MITLEYLDDGLTYIIGAKSIQEIDYVQGYTKPNYPMPAIPHLVTIQHDYVAIYGKYMFSFACWHKIDRFEYLNEWPSYYD